jgi:hypothetical protein
MFQMYGAIMPFAVLCIAPLVIFDFPAHQPRIWQPYITVAGWLPALAVLLECKPPRS